MSGRIIEDLEPTVYDKRFVGGQFEIAAHTFGRANKDPGTLFGAATPDVKALHAKIGRLAMENDFLAVALGRSPDASATR